MNTKEKIIQLRQKAQDYEMMIALRAQGWTLQQIADKYHVTRQRVYQIVGPKQPEQVTD